MIYMLSNEKMNVKISDLGAEIVSVTCDGKERVWQNDDGSWSRHCPVLFPVCGRSSVIIDGKDLGMPRHGFARDAMFETASVSDDSVTFVLKNSEKTLAVFPFLFELRITYTLNDCTMTVRNEIANIGEGEMRFALGRHDSFLLDEPIGNYELVFSGNERFLSLQTDGDGRLIDRYDDLGFGQTFRLPAEYLQNGRSVIFKNVNSNCAVLKKTCGASVVSLYWGEIRNIVLWRPGNANMICVEPWSALPDCSTGEPVFTKNNKFFVLSRGKRMTITFRYVFS